MCLVLLEWVLYRRFGQERFWQLYFFSVHLPCLLLSWLISKKRDTRIFFVLFLTIMYCSFALQGMSLVFLLSGGSAAAAWLSLVCITGAITAFTAFYFRAAFFAIAGELKRLLGILALLLAVYFFINGYLIPEPIGDNRLVNIVKLFITMTTMVVFLLTCMIFSIVRRKNEMQRDAELVSIQLDALRTKITAVKDAEEKIRIERHDIRHRLKTIEILLYENKKEEALAYLANAERRLDEIEPRRYCANTVLDAAVAYYCAEAEKSGIEVKVRLALSDALPVDSGELSVAVANALENAIHAAMECPAGKRKIWVRGTQTPTLMLEVANTAKTQPALGEDGLPMANREGHGVGSRSIAAFCKKNGAQYQYSGEDGVFRLRIYF